MIKKTFKQALKSFNLETVILPLKNKTPFRSKKQAEMMFARFSLQPEKTPGPYELDKSNRIIFRNWRHTKNLKQVAQEHIRRLPWVLFNKFTEEPFPLSDDENFLKYIFSQNIIKKSSSKVAALLRQFLVFYPETNRNIIMSLIDKLIKSCKSSRTKEVQQLVSDYHLLSSDGTQRFAFLLFEDSNKILTLPLFEKIIDGTEFLRQSFHVYFQHVYKGLRNDTISVNDLHSIFNVISSDKGRRRFDTHKKVIAESLLMPFVDKNADENIKSCIKDYISANYSYPSLSPASWHNIQPDAVKVYEKWLTEETLEDFFQILDITAGEQWQYRRDFWKSVLAKGLVKHAWVILGSKARGLAKMLPERTKRYAILKGGDSSQSVLLMNIGGFTVAEWSHSGKCRFWPSKHRNAPTMFRGEYYSTTLRTNCYCDFIHSYSEAGLWQDKIADFLYREIGVKLSRNEYYQGGY